MKSSIALALFCLLSMHFGCPTAKPATDDEEIKDVKEYLRRFDNLDVDQILSSDRLLDSHIKCYLNTAPCIPIARDLKRALPIVASNGCKDCNDIQIKNIKKALAYVKTKRAPEWTQMVALYDPTGTNLSKFLTD
ncbi:Insect odorant-binding protein A10/Ejaculatory bulb-specific protein 3 [Cinara cedri]|uniref:Insect odorant-binding protein A10/Ejaculatory bulb-specific protein 3 n=1 Tax=Cinara cedri TaxID=506608 RepID=A0A5E4MQN5_9HEMI|nr:Insect odorant-binding protein A10/Ejaculatory bulb-specific protein 3 [Cinara cedri]